jgi:thioredoxin 1
MLDLRFVDIDRFDRLTGSDGVAVVAFVATWNRRCQSFASSYQAMAERWASACPVVCVDVDECSALAARFEVCSVPTIFLFHGSRVVHREAGVSLSAVEVRIAELHPRPAPPSGNPALPFD